MHTVERFQGQQRDVIMASFALGDQDAIQDEDEFLMSLNRFNVMTARARAKLITLNAGGPGQVRSRGSQESVHLLVRP